jgi:hypothetical protein
MLRWWPARAALPSRDVVRVCRHDDPRFKRARVAQSTYRFRVKRTHKGPLRDTLAKNIGRLRSTDGSAPRTAATPAHESKTDRQTPITAG